VVDDTGLLDALATFATRSVTDYDLSVVLEEVGQQAKSVLGLQGAGITLKVRANDKEMQYISATDGMTLHVEREQDRLNEGVCVDSIQKGQPVTAHDVTAYADHWPRYVPVVVECGFRAVAGIPMLAGGRVIGALNAYRDQPGEWLPADVGAATLFANVATTYIANASAYSEQATLAAQLQQALDSRVLIEQAKGVLAERHGVEVDRAFEAMRRYARNQRVKLHDVAADVLSGRQTFEV